MYSLNCSDPAIFEDEYIIPWCRIGPYLIGIALAYVLFKKYKIKSVSIEQAAAGLPKSPHYQINILLFNIPSTCKSVCCVSFEISGAQY